jgi:hypothetical protein
VHQKTGFIGQAGLANTGLAHTSLNTARRAATRRCLLDVADVDAFRDPFH